MSKKQLPTAHQLHGKVLAFNISPRGDIEGALLQVTEGITQLNFPRHEARALAQSMRIGETIDIKAELEGTDGTHPVYTADGGNGAAGGVIARLNYALHGDVNGYHLEDGTFLHVKPDEAKKLKLRIGDKVTATGLQRMGTDATVLEVNKIRRTNESQVSSSQS